MSDIVFIHDLQVSCVIGVFDWERKIKQKLSFDIEMAADTTAAAKSDDLNDALDYKEVAKRVIERVETNEDLLVEKLANDLVDMIQNDFSVSWVKLKLAHTQSFSFQPPCWLAHPLAHFQDILHELGSSQCLPPACLPGYSLPALCPVL